MKRLTQIFITIVIVTLLGAVAGGDLRQVSATSTSGTTQEESESEMTEAEKAAKAEQEALEKEIQETYELPVQTNELEKWPEGPGTYGEAGIVMDVDSGAILYAKNIDMKEYPASITKVMTALLALQYGDMQSEVTISDNSLSCLGSGYASIGLKAGNVITMEQAMYAMLLASANEAAYAVGETVAEEQGQESGCEWFVEQMNTVCEELGGTNSNFVNTNGVFDEDHYTCARDMALIGRALFDYPLFFQICQTQQYVISESDTVEEHVFQQKHHMLLEGDSDYYEYAVGGKTGYTTEAENTLITMADNGERKLVCVVLKTYSGHPYSDTRALLEYGFGNFEKVSIAEQETDESFTWIEDGAYVLLPEKVSFDELDREVEASGDGRNGATVTYYYEGNPVGSCQVTLSEDYQGEGVTKWNSVAQQSDAGDSEDENFKPLLVFGAAVLLLVSGVIALIVTGISRKRKRRRRRR